MNFAKSKIFLLIWVWVASSLLWMTSCDAPRTTRTSSNGSTNSSAFNYGSPSSSSSGSLLDNSSNNGGTNSTGSGTSTSNSTITIPSGAENCDWSQDGTTGYNIGAAHFASDESTINDGAYNICQHPNSETTIFFQVKNSISSEQVCMIPMYDNAGYSTYLGEPRCFTPSTAGKIYTITLYKNRSGFTNYSINGVMMMRDKTYFFTSPYPTTYKIYTVDAYLYCSNYLAAYGSDAYCQAFSSAGHYVYDKF